MSTYTQILYQIVFSTYDRKETLIDSGRDRLFRYISRVLQNKKCHVYTIGGVNDHIHIITHVHPMIAPAMLIKDIKLASTEFIKAEKIFPDFAGWQDGYGAFTYSISAKGNLIEYVNNQVKHHKKFSFREEYIALLQEHGIAFDERYLF